MLTAIFAVLLLFVAQSMLPAVIRYLFGGTDLRANLMDALTGRDAPPPMPVLGGRAARALTNIQEALPVFLTLAILSLIQGPDGLAQWGAAVFLVARIVYVPAYLTAIPGVRSTVWSVSWVGLALMIASIIGRAAPLGG